MKRRVGGLSSPKGRGLGDEEEQQGGEPEEVAS